jgi:hypothetical protein
MTAGKQPGGRSRTLIVSAMTDWSAIMRSGMLTICSLARMDRRSSITCASQPASQQASSYLTLHRLAAQPGPSPCGRPCRHACWLLAASWLVGTLLSYKAPAQTAPGCLSRGPP